MKTYRAALIGCGRMAGPIEEEVRDLPGMVLPYAHGDGFEACERTDLVALTSRRAEAREWFGQRFGIPEERRYTDYREMIDRERPDIVTAGTQPGERAEMVIFAAEHGVKAIYAEKALAASMQETDAMVEAVERNGVVFNLGTQRRWNPGFDKMKEVIDSGELGPLRALITHYKGTLFNTMSHYFDLLLRLNSDRPVEWVQAHLPNGEDAVEGDAIIQDPLGHGMFQFDNGVTAYVLESGKGGDSEHEAICETGVMTQVANGADWQLRRFDREGEPQQFPPFERASPTLRIIEDLVHSLDTGEPTRGGPRVACASTELIFAFIESHRLGGARVELPLRDCELKYQVPYQPRPLI